ncbi:hypothetical protein AC1031_021893 [Aphanomyces cochlioides]|nr:hypothetical protein AC1031_021893 [Aphanomyces cochlioides]
MKQVKSTILMKLPTFTAKVTRARSQERVPMGARMKNRITLAAAVNADDSDKREIKFIGHSIRPRWFGDRSTEEMHLNYSSSKKGWMTSTLFNEWLECFNASMAKQDRKVLLLVDNASSLRAIESLSNVEVRFLPPNTTAYLQPLDAGIIAALKKKIQWRKTKMVLSKFEKLRRQHKAAGTKPSRREIIEIYKVDRNQLGQRGMGGNLNVDCFQLLETHQHRRKHYGRALDEFPTPPY